MKFKKKNVFTEIKLGTVVPGSRVAGWGNEYTYEIGHKLALCDEQIMEI